MTNKTVALVIIVVAFLTGCCSRIILKCDDKGNCPSGNYINVSNDRTFK